MDRQIDRHRPASLSRAQPPNVPRGSQPARPGEPLRACPPPRRLASRESASSHGLARVPSKPLLKRFGRDGVPLFPVFSVPACMGVSQAYQRSQVGGHEANGRQRRVRV